jgi:hypothetical protein
MNNMMPNNKQLAIISDISEEVEDVLMELNSPILQTEIAQGREDYCQGKTTTLGEVVAQLGNN